MDLYFFGNSREYIQAGYAPSNRASCRGCKEKIDKQALRIGLLLDDDHFNAKYWYHLPCFELKPRHLSIKEDEIDQRIYNIDHLESEDYDAVVQHIKSELQRLNDKKKGTKKKPKTDPKSQEPKKLTEKPKKKGGKKKKDKESSEQEYESSQQESSFSEESEESAPKKKKVKGGKKEPTAKSQPKKVVKKAAIKIYTAEQEREFKQLCQKYEEMTLQELKQILKKNNQAKTGTKKELVEKCADGKILGAIPTCTQCGGGKLRFDRKTGVYSCPGYMEDTDFVRCSKKFPFESIKREAWSE